MKQTPDDTLDILEGDVYAELPPADQLAVYVCNDRHVHLIMADVDGNTLGEMSYSVEDAWQIAAKITEAADRAAGL